MTVVPLDKLDESAATITVGWAPVPGCVGYRSRKDGGRWGITWNPAFRRDQRFPACNTVFSKPYARLEVEALLPGTAFEYPSQQPSYGPTAGPPAMLADMTSAQWMRAPAGGTSLAGLHVHDTPDYGLAAMVGWTPTGPLPPMQNPISIIDCVGERVGREPPTMNGTGETPLWMGDKGTVVRGRYLDGTWMSGWIGCHGRDVVMVDCVFGGTHGLNGLCAPRVGLYPEHGTRRLRMIRCAVYAVGNGMNIEWAYHDPALYPYLAAEYPSIPAGVVGTIDVQAIDCDFYSEQGAAVFADAGTSIGDFTNCRFAGRDGVAEPANKLIPGAFTFNGCDFSGVTGRAHYVHQNAIGHAPSAFHALTAEEILDVNTTRQPTTLLERMAA